MKIAINTRLLLKDRLDGIGWFTYHITRQFAIKHPDVQFVYLFDRPFDPSYVDFPNVEGVYSGPPARHPLLYIAWYEYTLPRLLKSIDPDLIIHPDGFVSLSVNKPQLTVIHDLNFEHYPNDLPFSYRKYYRHFFPRFAKKADRIATVSGYSKEDISKTYNIPLEKIDVVYNGVNELYLPLMESEKKNTMERYSGNAPYFLFVGSLHPRKNIVNMFKAFDEFKQVHQTNHKLLIVGEKKWWTSEIETTYKMLINKADVIFTGRLDINELTKVCGAATCMLYVSIFEGFGVPIIEAMRCGTPVITSQSTSMPEVASDAALLTDPFDFRKIANTMGELVNNKALQLKLREAGIDRADYFSWDKTSDLLWESAMNLK